ncbi:MAG TPA: alpha/beta hydrolase [Candidatus Angelobacter sp.]|nr:alpha/beta hydrolase [Candidatus Angelobacter sp.]
MPTNRNVVRTALFLSFLLGTAFAQQHTPELREDYVTTTTGIRIHCLESGEHGSKRVLVVIPGWRLPAFLWNEQIKKFAPIIRVVAFDPRSQGKSTKVSENNTPEARAQDLHDLLNMLGISDPILVGWSQGAQDVAAYIQQFGADSVAGVVFVDTAVSAGPTEIEIARPFSKIILSEISDYASHPKEFSAGMVQSLFKKPHPELDMQQIVQSTLETPTETGIAMLVSDIFGVDRRSGLTKLKKPTLVIGSSESPLIEFEKEMAASIPGTKPVFIGGTGHAVFIDEPQRFNTALKNFLQSLPPAPR